MKKILFAILLFCSSFVFVFPQEDFESGGLEELEGDEESFVAAGEDDAEPKEEEPPSLTPQQEIYEMDIRTSSLAELASWCRSLGLSEGGTKDELATRLRNHFGLPAAGRSVSQEGRIIVIESARTTEYFTLDVVDEEYARLRGNVVISLKDGNSVHRIKAWEITYNRTRNVMTASGGVEYVKETDDSIETFRGETITVNLDNWSSIFMDGFSERSASSGGTAYRFAGTVISRNSEESTVLTRAEITNGQNEDSLWSLNASKLWLLPGSDWAVLNAVLKVGNIPVLWLPFFFYPTDEIVFHPVLGYRSREGTFVNTTTYVLGRPKSSGFTENSITKIFGGASDGEKVREGLFLRSSGKKTRPSNETNLSVLFDAYANMGAYLGAELTVPRNGIIGELNLSLGLGLTRNIYSASYGSTPYKDQDGVSDWNSSFLFSQELPLRYRLEAKSSLSWQYASLSWDFPLYSDPYVNRDFMTNRKEELDWLAMLREGAGAEPELTAASGISSYSWSLNGSINPRVSFLNPYVNSFSISGISGSMNFISSRNSSPGSTTAASPLPNPDGVFFVPNKLSMSFNVSAAGFPFTLGAPAGTSYSSGASGQPAPGDALLPAPPREPWEDDSDEKSVEAADPHRLEPPVLGQRFSLSQGGGPKIDFDYRLTPTGGFEQQFSDNPDWSDADSIEWEVASRLLQAGVTLNMGFALSQPGSSAYSGSFRINNRGSWQDYTYINEDSYNFRYAGSIASARSRAHGQTSINSVYDFSTTYRPFFQNPVWGASGITYSLSGLVGNYKFDADASTVTDTEDDPRWKWETGKWDNQDVKHEAKIDIYANVMDYTQSLSLSSTLWPNDTVLRGDATARAWISQTSIRTSIEEPFNEDKRVFKPVDLSEKLTFSPSSSLTLALKYEPEAEREIINSESIKEPAFTSFTTSLDFYGFRASYASAYIVPYKFDSGKGWVQDGTSKSLEHQSLRFSYGKRYNINNLWNNRLSLDFTLNTNLDFDLQRYTYSTLNFGLTMNMKISNFLDIGLSVSSTNSQVYQYFQFLPFFTADVPSMPGFETNFFKDLLNSFRFDDDDLRRSSGFKARTFSMLLTHHLGDWNAILGIDLSPIKDESGSHPVIVHNYKVSFLIKWVPIEEVKTEFIYDQQQITFN